MPLTALFVFDRANWCSVFPSVQDAEDQLETNDVEAGEYAVYDCDGTVFDTGVDGQRVVLSPTDARDPAELRTRVDRFLRAANIDCPSDDLIDQANAILKSDWEHRWPKRPRWLSRRLFGDEPPAIRR